MSKKKSNIGKFVLGLGIGAGIGILFAPKSGKETQKELKAKLNELTEKAKELDVEEVKDAILEKVDEIKATIQDLDREKVKDIAIDQAGLLKEKTDELIELTKEKTTPVINTIAKEVRNSAIVVTKEILKRLETEEEK
ncbi:MAG: YtxH domain-containing protein [Bacilli bacterium]|nr:YtxH domain-containing protein [Bacilli bacterium]